jgi:hypothetical protein
VPEWGKVNDALNNYASTIYTDPEADINALMESANQDVQDILDEYWAGQ